jgi:signal transduction histidine kinase
MNITRVLLEAPFSRRTRREYGYAVASLLVAAPAFAVALLATIAAALSLFAVGLPLLAGSLAIARLSIGWFRTPARILGWDWPTPPPPAGSGVVRRAVAIVRDRDAWRAVLCCLLKFPLAAVTVYLGGVLLVMGSAAATCPLWWSLTGDGFGLLGLRSWSQSWLLAAQGAAAVLAFPWFVRLLVGVDHALSIRLLAPDRDRARIAQLETSRATLTADSTALLRRIERDLHDGTQARLVSIGLMLSRLESKVTDPTARGIVDAARHTVVDGLDELREIIRGMHPPALDDGLPTALATLASRGPVPTEFSGGLCSRPSDAAAAALYYTATELLTNVARHADATRAQIGVAETADTITLVVRDDGRGGARPSPSRTGLAGLRHRAEALDGNLAIDSPDGGPTTVTMTLPKS